MAQGPAVPPTRGQAPRVCLRFLLGYAHIQERQNKNALQEKYDMVRGQRCTKNYLHIAVSSTGPLGSVLAPTVLQPHHIQTLLIPI